MALTSTGLTDIGMGAGFTTNFQVQYETGLFDSLAGAQKNTVRTNLVRNANALLAVIENEFNVTTGWFSTPGGSFGTGRRQVVNLNLADGSGANNSGYGNPMNLDAQSGNANAAQAAGIVEMVFMNEWVEILMDLTGGKWNRGDSSGEGLSQYAGIVRFQAGHYNYYGSWVNGWLNTIPRQDWVTTTQGTDTNSTSFGCALAFIYYLNVQLNFSINQIIAAGAANLATTYRTLTGDSGNPFPFFAALLERVFPSSTPASIPGPVPDNPFPLGQLSFWVDKNTFGKDEVQDVIATNGGVWPKAFWLVVEGFSRNSFTALGVTIPAPTGAFAGVHGVTISQNPDIDFENAANPQAPQRIRVPYDIRFSAASLPEFPAGGSRVLELDARLTRGGNTVPGSAAATQFELVAGADPYFTNIDPAQNNVAYLSQDLRVFTATPGQNSNPVPGAPAFTSDSVPGAFTYIQQLLNWLNSNFSDPNGIDPFNSVLPSQGGALQGDSSVTPYTLAFRDIFNLNLFANYNFAVARVRLRGPAGPTHAAQKVRVFFRLWSTETTDSDYQPNSTYPSTPDPSGLPGFPLVGTDHITLPFFASGNFSGNNDYASGGANIRNVQINTGHSVWAYYGCFLNLYDDGNVIDGRPIQSWLNGTHHCLVAQIAYDNTPLFVGANPAASDKLAQRNLQITRSDNPGPADTHRIPQTFDIRPSTTVGPSVYPDELMIDWGTVPAGSMASIYWPQVMASEVIRLASTLYSSHTLSAADEHTIQCKVTEGISYIPIPTGTGDNFAGLFTLDLPTTVLTGQEFNIVVRRIATRETTPDIPVHSLPATVDLQGKKKASKQPPPAAAAVAVSKPRSWRYVVGTFQVKIPVSDSETMLIPEENTLAIMKWRLEQMAPSNRWYPVLQRYISYIAGRVDGLGGDSTSILPSPHGVPPKQIIKAAEREYTGRICEVLFDCFGDFEGFVLADCRGAHIFKSHERRIGELVLRACEDQLLISVYVGKTERILRLVIRC